MVIFAEKVKIHQCSYPGIMLLIKSKLRKNPRIFTKINLILVEMTGVEPVSGKIKFLEFTSLVNFDLS